MRLDPKFSTESIIFLVLIFVRQNNKQLQLRKII